MLNLFLKNERACHKDLLLQHLITVVEGLPKLILFTAFKNLFGID
jgi:hypothetical protein|tara:strand:- start:499 stop:633 length:135 start_codon:yes stop_codon:yes gene_type:complete